MDTTGKYLDKTMTSYLKALGSRIMCELNDLKRTPEAAAVDLDIDIDKIYEILNGHSTEKETFDLINKMGSVYPIDHTHMYLLRDDTNNGIKYMSAEDSYSTRRIYNRPNSQNELTPYYEYRDTAMSRLAPFKPEWISQLRFVENDDPNNPNVVLNKGHFMHQITLFVGPVNFYYEDLDGIIHCHEMNTGDCNYITPFMKHSFTSRDKNRLAYIIACTFGGDLSHAQKELYSLGTQSLKNYVLDYREGNKASIQIIKQHMKNDMLTLDNMSDILKEKGHDIDIKEIFETCKKLTFSECEKIADALNLEVSDIMFPEYKSSEECIVKKMSENKPHAFPNNEKVLYNIHTLARTSKMPLLRNSVVDIICKKPDLSHFLQLSLHVYMINFSDYPADLMWEHEGKVYSKTINPNDSIYLKPFVKFAFGNSSNGLARVLVVGTSSTVNYSAQKELSTILEPHRVINQMDSWYER